MKLSMNQASLCRMFGLEGGLKLIKEVGFENVDWDFCQYDIKSPIIPEDYRMRFAEIRELLREIGLGCDETHSPYPASYAPTLFHYGDEMTPTNPRFAAYAKAFEATAILGATKTVLHPLAVPQGGGTKEYMDYNYTFYKTLEPYAKEFGVKIGVENLEKTSGNLYKVEWQEEMLDRLDSEQFYALVDLGHAASSDTTPDAHLRGLTRGRVQGLHFHDFNTQEPHIVPSFGVSDWDAVAKTLAELGYEGDIAFEVEGTYQRFPKSLIPEALRFTVKSGRIFVRKYERERAYIKNQQDGSDFLTAQREET